MPKERVNLFLDRDAMERARRYSQKHDTSVSRLVSDYLAGLPTEEAEVAAELTPTVRRLVGVAAGGGDRKAYREYLYRKYGR